jgi:glycosyltransferase involved in cell wall biosynthesis
MGLSVILITKNEEANLAACLESVSFADEIVLVDSGSCDQTVAIARQYRAVVKITEDWPGFGIQKNRALALATQEWVLSIDADERVTPELQLQILAVIKNPQSLSCYALSRLSFYCGRFMKHSGWFPDFVPRLFRRGTACFSDHLVHERLLPTSPVGQLDQFLLHYSFRDFSSVLKKVDAYSSSSAQQAFDQGKRSSVGKAVLHGFWAFVRTYFIRLGFLDGAHGLALAISNAEGSYYRYLKIWLMQQGQTK